MPGVDLNLPIPALSDTQATVITKVAQALTAIENDLTPRVTSNEININTPLSFNGLGAENLGYATFNGTPSSVVSGTIFFSGEWFLVTAAGTIQLTNNGALNISIGGGIGGDYGAVSALVTYDNANTRYRFFGSSAASLVDLDARNFVSNGTLAKVTISVDPTFAVNRIFNFKSLPTSGIALLTYDSVSSSVTDGSAAPITANHTFSGVSTFTGNIVANALIKHTAWSKELPFTSGPGSTNLANFAGPGVDGLAPATPGVAFTWVSEPFGLRKDDIVNSVVCRITKGSAGTTTLSIRKKDAAGTITTVESATSTSVGTGDITCTVAAPVAIGARERWFLQFDSTTSAADTITNASVSWTQ